MGSFSGYFISKKKMFSLYFTKLLTEMDVGSMVQPKNEQHEQRF